MQSAHLSNFLIGYTLIIDCAIGPQMHLIPSYVSFSLYQTQNFEAADCFHQNYIDTVKQVDSIFTLHLSL